MNKLAAASAFALVLIGGLGLAFAQNVSDAQIRQNLEAQGYKNIQISRHEKNHVDVTGTKDGKLEKLAVNPQTGQMSSDTDNDER